MNTIDRRSFLAGTALMVAGVRPSFAADVVDMETAKKEGKVVWYCSTPVATAQKISNMFQAKTGIKVELFRSGGSNILRRFQQEGDSGNVFVDVLTHSDPAPANALAKRGLFVPFKPTDFDKVPAEVKDPQGMHIAQRLNVMAIYVRDDMLPEADRPKTWSDLLNPKFKGKIVMPDPNFSSLLVVITGSLAKEHGWKYFEALRKNDIMVVQSNQQVSDMIKRGERPIAMAADAAYVGPARKEGLKATILYPSDGAFVIASPTSVVKGSPNPNAAKAFADFMLSREVQEMFPSEFLYSSRTDVAGPPGYPSLTSFKIHAVDYEYIEKESSRIKRQFAEAMQ